MKTLHGVFEIRTWLLIALFCLAMMILLAKAAGASAGRVDKESAKEKTEQGLASPEQAFFTLSLPS